MTPDLPERWDDEPWPLDDPDVGTHRVINRSDTHDVVPQVADLADEAWEYAVDHGVSMERALVELQRRRFHEWSAPRPQVNSWDFTTRDRWVALDPPHVAFVKPDGEVVVLSDFVKSVEIFPGGDK